MYLISFFLSFVWLPFFFSFFPSLPSSLRLALFLSSSFPPLLLPSLAPSLPCSFPLSFFSLLPLLSQASSLFHSHSPFLSFSIIPSYFTGNSSTNKKMLNRRMRNLANRGLYWENLFDFLIGSVRWMECITSDQASRFSSLSGKYKNAGEGRGGEKCRGGEFSKIQKIQSKVRWKYYIPAYH